MKKHLLYVFLLFNLVAFSQDVDLKLFGQWESESYRIVFRDYNKGRLVVKSLVPQIQDFEFYVFPWSSDRLIGVASEFKYVYSIGNVNESSLTVLDNEGLSLVLEKEKSGSLVYNSPSSFNDPDKWDKFDAFSDLDYRTPAITEGFYCSLNKDQNLFLYPDNSYKILDDSGEKKGAYSIEEREQQSYLMLTGDLNERFLIEEGTPLKMITLTDQSNQNKSRYIQSALDNKGTYSSLNEELTDALRRFFVGAWSSEEFNGWFTVKTSIEFRNDGSIYASQTGMDGKVNKGEWFIDIVEQLGKNRLYLNLFIPKSDSDVKMINRMYIPLESIEEKSFAAYSVNGVIENSNLFERTDNLEIPNSLWVEGGPAILGAVTALALFKGITEEAAADQYSSKNANNERLMRIWREERARQSSN